MVHRPPLALALTISVCLTALLLSPVRLDLASDSRTFASPAVGRDIVEKRTIAPGERTVLTVKTAGVVEVVIYEHAGEPELLQAFHAGQAPRTARVFTNIKELVYPLASVTGGDFYVRVRPLSAGETSLHYEPGTIDEAMAGLRNGQHLVRNRGTVWLRSGLHQLPVYQLVPGIAVRVEILSGRGTVALLRTREYLAVRDGRTALVSRCTAGTCIRSETGGRVLELLLDDYDDRYLLAAAEGSPLTFAYQVIATPQALNYITTCT